jgi:hypothetical protein
MKVLIVLLTLLSSPLFGQITDSLSLLKGIEQFEQWRKKEVQLSEKDKSAATLAVGYIRGSMETTQILETLSPGSTPWRFPSETSTEQLLRVIKKYADAHPEELHRAACLLIVNAFADSFPNPDFKPNTKPEVPK